MNINNTPVKNILFAFAALFVCNTSMGQTPDPGLMGTHTVAKKQYDLGDAYFAAIPTYMNHTMECRGSVHYPTDLNNGPYPVLVWLHGRHSTCYNPTTGASSSAWPCPTGRLPIRSYEGYDYAARTMASHGYIVISISANAINAYDGVSGFSSDAGMTARGRLIQWHLDLWKGWNTTDTGLSTPFGNQFKGRLNLQNVGTMGHSRGGEGAIYNAEYNRSLGSPYGIKAVLTLAPVDFFRHVLNDITVMNIAPYCDGDVWDLQGVYYYDDARYKSVTDETPKHNVLVMGTNHNYFNTVWSNDSSNSSGDDWGSGPDPYCGEGMLGNGRLDSIKQKAVYNTYAAAFYRLYMGKETKFAPILECNNVVPPASSMVDTSIIFVSYHAGKTDRLDVNRVDSVYNLTNNNVGGTVTTSALTAPAVCGGGLTVPVCDPGLGDPQKPHMGTTGSGGIKGLNQMRIRWSDTTGSYTNNIPQASQDFTQYQNLAFRACVNFSETTTGAYNYFSVQLIDSAGAKATELVNKYSHALFYQKGNETMVLPKVCFNTIHIPIDSFKNINLAKVRQIKFLFNRSAAGAVLVSDVALDNPVCGNLDAAYTDSVPTTGKVIYFTNKSTATTGDTVTRLWKFGDPTSGVNDTSTKANPTHTYAKSGTYTVCLYVTVKRKSNGFTCIDSFCKTVTRPVRAGVEDMNTPAITIIPNPAKDYLQIDGAEKTDVLRIVNLYGQEVFSTVLTQPIVNLPQFLPAGLYYAIVVTPRGNVHEKILITR
ncbi:MAG: hypothetical protein K0Q79_915 [Flavipsychrobacter sp.]|jgi:hypothetical protein|nr:hypothetical protein [Flavipsychrobacter sp.]